MIPVNLPAKVGAHATLASLAWRELRANHLIRELTTPLRLVVKNTHTELLLVSESLETKAKPS